jgi:hypothetical protein
VRVTIRGQVQGLWETAGESEEQTSFQMSSEDLNNVFPEIKLDKKYPY